MASDNRHHTEQELFERAQRFLAQRDEAIEILTRVLSQVESNRSRGNVEVGSDDTIIAYRLPCGPVHAAIPFLARFGIRVDEFGTIHRFGLRNGN